MHDSKLSQLTVQLYCCVVVLFGHVMVPPPQSLSVLHTTWQDLSVLQWRVSLAACAKKKFKSSNTNTTSHCSVDKPRVCDDMTRLVENVSRGQEQASPLVSFFPLSFVYNVIIKTLIKMYKLPASHQRWLCQLAQVIKVARKPRARLRSGNGTVLTYTGSIKAI